MSSSFVKGPCEQMHHHGVICKGQRCSTFCFMKVDFLLTFFLLLCCNHFILHSDFFFSSEENKRCVSVMVCGLRYEQPFCSLFSAIVCTFALPLWCHCFLPCSSQGQGYVVASSAFEMCRALSSQRRVHVFCAILFFFFFFARGKEAFLLWYWRSADKAEGVLMHSFLS